MSATIKPSTQDVYIAAGANALIGVVRAAFLAKAAGALARRSHVAFGTHYTPLTRREAFALAWIARRVYLLLFSPGMKGTSPEDVARKRAEVAAESGEHARSIQVNITADGVNARDAFAAAREGVLRRGRRA